MSRFVNRTALAAVVIVSLLAAGAGIAVNAAPAPAPGDERLERYVTSRVIDRPLRDWLVELSRETGVRLSTSLDYEDRAITARVREMPLRRLMDAVAALYGDYWKPNPKLKVGGAYVLCASEARRA